MQRQRPRRRTQAWPAFGQTPIVQALLPARPHAGASQPQPPMPFGTQLNCGIGQLPPHAGARLCTQPPSGMGNIVGEHTCRPCFLHNRWT